MLEFIFITAFGLNMALTPVPKPFDVAYIQETYVEAEPVKFYTPPKWVLGSCINTAKFIITGKVSHSWGNASQQAVLSELEPYPGVLVKTNEGPYYHIGVVSSV